MDRTKVNRRGHKTQREGKMMGWQPTQAAPPPVPKKLKKLDGNINNTDVVIVYGDVKGNVNNCDNVIVINGDVYGNISNCDNVAGLLADKAVRCHVEGEI